MISKQNLLQPVNIEIVWEEIKNQVAYVIDRIGSDLKPQDIYDLCHTNQAVLLMSEKAFTVLQVIETLNTRSMYSIITYGEGKVFEDGLEQILTLAKKLGCGSFNFHSNRKGYERKLGPEWKRSTKYSIEVPKGD